MLITKNQIFVFIACISFGGVSGIFLSLAEVLKKPINVKPLKILPDVAAFILIAAAYVVFSFKLNFPSYRIYMTVGVFLGLALYYKSLHVILAKCTQKAYNKTIKRFFEFLKTKKGKTKDGKRGKIKRAERVKVQKTGGRSHGRRSSFSNNTRLGNELSTDSHKQRKTRHSGVRT